MQQLSLNTFKLLDHLRGDLLFRMHSITSIDLGVIKVELLLTDNSIAWMMMILP